MLESILLPTIKIGLNELGYKTRIMEQNKTTKLDFPKLKKKDPNLVFILMVIKQG